MWTLSTSVVLSGWFAGVFSVFRDGVLSFSVSVLWSVFCYVRLMCIVGRCGSVGCIRFGTFRCLTVSSVVHMVRNMLTLRLQLLKVFRLHVMPRHVFETKRNLGNETSETPVFPKPQFLLFVSFLNAGYVMQKPSRNRSRLGHQSFLVLAFLSVDQEKRTCRARSLASVNGQHGRFFVRCWW